MKRFIATWINLFSCSLLLTFGTGGCSLSGLNLVPQEPFSSRNLVPQEPISSRDEVLDVISDVFSSSISGAGDVNDDGFDDVIVGALLDDNNGSESGSARVFSGADGSILYTFDGDSAYSYFGGSVSGAGDVNKDGYADVIVGAVGDSSNGIYSGSARVFSGINGSIIYTLNGDSAYDYFGGSVSGAGDINGDGYDDVIVGARFDDNNGADPGSARVFSGLDGAILYTFYGDSAGDYFGISVSGAGDVNGDGYDDVIVGAHNDDNNGSVSGSARVFSGVDGTILYTFDGDGVGDYFGSSVSSAGDVNGDGFDDVIVGAPNDDNNGSDSGSARVFSGADGSILYTFDGDSVRGWFGKSVSHAGDVNGDGFDDVIVGAPNDDSNGTDSGSARVFSGIDGSVLYTRNGDRADDQFGGSVSGAGDVNGDGKDELLISSKTKVYVIESQGDPQKRRLSRAERQQRRISAIKAERERQQAAKRAEQERLEAAKRAEQQKQEAAKRAALRQFKAFRANNLHNKKFINAVRFALHGDSATYVTNSTHHSSVNYSADNCTYYEWDSAGNVKMYNFNHVNWKTVRGGFGTIKIRCEKKCREDKSSSISFPVLGYNFRKNDAISDIRSMCPGIVTPY